MGNGATRYMSPPNTRDQGQYNAEESASVVRHADDNFESKSNSATSEPDTSKRTPNLQARQPAPYGVPFQQPIRIVNSGIVSTVVADRIRHRNIEKQLKEDALIEQKRVKILLLGGAETGKTTLFKQMRILHLNGFSAADRAQFRQTIHANIVMFVTQLLHAAKLANHVHEKHIQRQIKHFESFAGDFSMDECIQIPADIGAVIDRIWQSSSVQTCFKRRFEYKIHESAKYFLDNIIRVTADDYDPTHQDILHCRLRTTGIHQITFDYKTLNFLMVDVGGQKSERRKWMHCFDNVQLVLFVISLADYDLADQDDPEKNRLTTNLAIFRTIVRSEHFRTASVALFMNKEDVFRDKLDTGGNIKVCFDDFEYNASSADPYKDSLSHILSKFKGAVSTRKLERFYPFATTATKTDNIQKVFGTSVNHLIHRNLKATGLQL